MRTVKKEGSNNHVILMLHGTGGSADDLFQIGTILDKDATFVGFEGMVLENGMRRYFERYPDGTFNLRSLAENSKKLYVELNKVIDEYADKDITLIGYSNGSNIFLNVLKEYENLRINQAILYHPSPVRSEVSFKPQTLKVLLTSGKNDPFITEKQFSDLKDKMKDDNIDVEVYSHELGHQLIQEELDYSIKFLRGNYEKTLL